MIKLIRVPTTHATRVELAAKCARYLGLLARNELIPDSLGRSYKNAKPTLSSESHEKCGYCESKIPHVYPGDVEHICPKASYPQKQLEYDNLILACFTCNHNKGDIYDPNNPFIDPYVDDPERHLMAIGTFVWSRPGDQRAKLTEMQLDLNRPELIERRRQRLNYIRSLVESWSLASSPQVKEAVRNQIRLACDDSEEYSLVCRALVQSMMAEPQTG